MRESDIEKYFVKRVKELGGWQRKFISPNCKGVPDRIVKLAGWESVLFVELKAPGKTLRPDQEREHKKMRAVGCYPYVLDSVEKVNVFLGW